MNSLFSATTAIMASKAQPQRRNSFIAVCAGVDCVVSDHPLRNPTERMGTVRFDGSGKNKRVSSPNTHIGKNS